MLKYGWIVENLKSTLNDGVQVWAADRFWRNHVWLMHSLNVMMLGIFPAVAVGKSTFEYCNKCSKFIEEVPQWIFILAAKMLLHWRFQ